MPTKRRKRAIKGKVKRKAKRKVKAIVKVKRKVVGKVKLSRAQLERKVEYLEHRLRTRRKFERLSPRRQEALATLYRVNAKKAFVRTAMRYGFSDREAWTLFFSP